MAEATEKTMIQMVAEIRKLTGKNIGAKTIKDLKEQKVALDAQQTELENMRKGIEELGGVAEQDSNYNKMVVDYEKNKADLEKRNQRLTIRDRFNQFRESVKSGKVQERISKGIDGIKDGFKGFASTLGDIKDSAVSGIKDVGTFGLALFLPALIAFLNSRIYNKAKKYILDEVLPSLTKFYNDYIVPLGKKLEEMGIGGKEIGIGAILTYLTVKMFPLIKTLSGAFMSLGGGILKFTGKITGVLVKYGLQAGGKIVGLGLKALTGSFSALGNGLRSIGGGISGVAGQSVSKSGKLMGLLKTGLGKLKGGFETVGNAVINGAKALTSKESWMKFDAGVSNFFKSVGESAGKLKDNLFGAVGKAKRALTLKNLDSAAEGFFKNIKNSTDGILASVKKMPGKVITALKGAFTAMRLFFMTTLIPTITAFLAPFAPLIVGIAAVTAAIYGVYKLLTETEIGQKILGAFKDMFNKVVGFIGELYGGFIEKLSQAFDFGKTFVKDLFEPVLNFISGIYDKFIKPYIDKALDFLQPILDVINPIIDKIKSVFAAIFNAVKGMIAGLIPDFVYKFLPDSFVNFLKGEQVGAPVSTSTPTSKQAAASARTETITQGTMTDQAGGAPQVNIVNNSTDNRTNQQNVQSNSHPVMDNDPLLKSLIGAAI